MSPAALVLGDLFPVKSALKSLQEQFPLFIRDRLKSKAIVMEKFLKPTDR